MKVKSLSPVRLLATRGLQPTRLLRPWDFLGKSTGVGCHCLLRHDVYISYNIYTSIYASHYIYIYILFNLIGL